MTQNSHGSPNPFDVARHAETADGLREPVRQRRMSLPLRMDDQTVKTFELPGALERPSQFTSAEFERLTRAYAEALGLLDPKTND